MSTEIDKELTIELLVSTVHSFTLKNGYAPSVRDLAEALDIRSTATVHKYLTIARRRGVLTHTPGVVRSLRVTPEGKHLV